MLPLPKPSSPVIQTVTAPASDPAPKRNHDTPTTAPVALPAASPAPSLATDSAPTNTPGLPDATTPSPVAVAVAAPATSFAIDPASKQTLGVPDAKAMPPAAPTATALATAVSTEAIPAETSGKPDAPAAAPVTPTAFPLSLTSSTPSSPAPAQASENPSVSILEPKPNVVQAPEPVLPAQKEGPEETAAPLQPNSFPALAPATASATAPLATPLAQESSFLVDSMLPPTSNSSSTSGPAPVASANPQAFNPPPREASPQKAAQGLFDFNFDFSPEKATGVTQPPSSEVPPTPASPDPWGVMDDLLLDQSASQASSSAPANASVPAKDDKDDPFADLLL